MQSTFPLRLLVLAGVFGVSVTLGWACGRSTSTAPNRQGNSAAAGVPLASPRSGAGRVFEDLAGQNIPADYRREVQLAKAAAALDLEETVAALERARARHVKKVVDRDPVTEALLARYAELDPAAATTWLLGSYPYRDLPDSWLGIVLDAWVTRDQDAALKWARGLPGGGLRQGVVTGLINRLSAIDPAAAERQIAAFRAGSEQLTGVYKALAEKDLAAALARANGLPTAERSEALGGVLQVWIARDPAAAAAWITQLPLGSPRTAAMNRLCADWGARDPAAAAAFLTGQNPRDRSIYSMSLVANWVQQDLEGALHWSEALPPGMYRRGALSQVVDHWAQRDPHAALDYVLARRPSERDQWISQAVGGWAKQDLTAAFNWAESLPPGNTRRDAASAVYSTWAEQDRRGCAEYLLAHQDKADPNGPLDDILRGWANEAPEEVWKWSRGLADEEQRSSAGSSAVSRLAQTDPVQASVLLKELGETQQAQVFPELATQWAKVDLPGLQRWAANLPAGETRDSAWGSMVSAWSQYDLPGAAAWLDKQPPGPDRDAGIGQIIQSNFELTPTETLRIVRSMTDPERREGSLEQLANNWLQTDRPAATAWIQGEPAFSPEIRSNLLTVPTEDSGDDE